jgi:hypothetical protein
LTINREKSGIRRPVQFTCLGFGFVPTYRKGERGGDFGQTMPAFSVETVPL